MGNKIRNEHYYEGYQYALQNANNHLLVAERIKDICFGQAFAHLVLATEEALKAIMLLTCAFDAKPMSPKESREYFSNHKYKHKAIKAIELTTVVVDKMYQLSLEPILNSTNKNLTEEELSSLVEVGLQNASEFIHNLAKKGISNIDLNYNKDWWDQADANKQQGFYVDELSKIKSWKGPQDFSPRRYEKGHKITTAFIEKVKNFEEQFQQKEVQELFEEIRQVKEDKTDKGVSTKNGVTGLIRSIKLE